MLSLVSMDNFSLTKLIFHRTIGDEFAFTHSKDYLYYLARACSNEYTQSLLWSKDKKNRFTPAYPSFTI